MLQLTLILVSFLGLFIHAKQTEHKVRFSKIDIYLFSVFFAGISVPILTLIFNFK